MRPSVRGRNRLWLAVGLAMVVAAALPEAHAQRAKRAARPPAASTSKRPAKGAKARPAKGAKARPAKAAATEAAASKAAPTRGQANAARERLNRGAALYQHGRFGPA